MTQISVQKVDIQQRKVNLFFKYPYVDDGLRWNDPIDKSKGYKLIDGQFHRTIEAELIKSKGKRTKMKNLIIGLVVAAAVVGCAKEEGGDDTAKMTDDTSVMTDDTSVMTDDTGMTATEETM